MSEMGKITVSDIATRVIEEDDDGYISIAIKAQVQNGSDETECFITLQGLDRDGFAIYDIHLEGTIPIGSSKVLTKREDYVDKKIFEQIVDWQAQ